MFYCLLYTIEDKVGGNLVQVRRRGTTWPKVLGYEQRFQDMDIRSHQILQGELNKTLLDSGKLQKFKLNC